MLDSLSPKQLDLVSQAISTKDIILAGGATRSGKTIAANIAFAIYVANHLNYQHALFGWSIESLVRNVVMDLIPLFKSMGIKAELTHNLGTRIVINRKPKPCNIYLVGATDVRAQRRIQGATIGGALGDEIVAIPESLWNMMVSRLTFNDSKLFGTFNPENPQHWFKLQVVDHIEEFNGILYKFLFDDNPSLSEEVKERFRNTLRGHWGKRLVEGEWAGAGGLIFPTYQTDLHELENFKYIYSIDWGVASVFAALEIEHTTKKSNVVNELNYDARVTKIARTDAEHAQAFHNFAQLKGRTVFIDPTTSRAFQKILRQYGYKIVNADNSVLKGLALTNTRLSVGEVRISKVCKELIRCLGNYMWDEKAAEIGEDKPIKQDDHLPDCLRYYTSSTTTTRMIKQSEVDLWKLK